jgi:plasmid maintenance system antidote protein VapI
MTVGQVAVAREIGFAVSAVNTIVKHAARITCELLTFI